MAAARPAWARASGSSAAIAPKIPSTAIDWRQSAKSQHLFVREREWEAAQIGVVLARRLGRHALRVGQRDARRERANLLLLALASLLVRGGERVALLGDGHAPGQLARSRCAASAMRCSTCDAGGRAALPPDAADRARTRNSSGSSDFLPPDEIEATHAAAVARRASAAIWCTSSIRRKRIFPIPAARASKPCSGRDERDCSAAPKAWASAYRARFKAHGETRRRAAARRLGWTITAHRTDHAPQTALIALHAAIGGA